MSEAAEAKRPIALRLALQSYAKFFLGLRWFWPFLTAYILFSIPVYVLNFLYAPENIFHSWTVPLSVSVLLYPELWFGLAAIPSLILWQRRTLQFKFNLRSIMGVVFSGKGFRYFVSVVFLLIFQFLIWSVLAVDGIDFLPKNSLGILLLLAGLLVFGFVSNFANSSLICWFLGLVVGDGRSFRTALASMRGFRMYGMWTSLFIFTFPILLYYLFHPLVADPILWDALCSYALFILGCTWAIAQAEIYRMIVGDASAAAEPQPN